MRPSEFDFNKFHYHMEEQQKRLRRFASNTERFLPVVQRPGGEHFDTMSHCKEDSLAAQLSMLADSIKLYSDFGYNYLEPWHGVGVYAAAFGSEVVWYRHSAPQTRYAYHSIDEIRNLAYPDLKKCEMLQMVLETIRYFREQTGDAIPLCLTDTQSPNDTASLILDSCAFFEGTIEEPETVAHLLRLVTRLITEFSDIQREAIGAGNICEPGHTIISDTTFQGISLSEDNMAFISPSVFATSAMPYNQELSNHFGGIAVHSCGEVKHNLPLLTAMEGLQWVELAVGYGNASWPVDPNPNNAEDLLELFAGTDITVKARVGPFELERIFPLLTPRVKLIVDLCTYGSIDERNRQYSEAKEILLANYHE
ncbi:MAG: hypothetical protein FWF86_05925 [Clostridia bacterium]|nr:hypothetical protein [Clostridia bacterium]